MEIRPVEDQYVKEQLALGNLKPAITQSERIRESAAIEKRTKDERELRALLSEQSRLRIEIKYARLNNMDTRKARLKLLKVNTKIGDLKRQLDRGKLFDPQEDHSL
jgi:hypothetical protein